MVTSTMTNWKSQKGQDNAVNNKLLFCKNRRLPSDSTFGTRQLGSHLAISHFSRAISQLKMHFPLTSFCGFSRYLEKIVFQPKSRALFQEIYVATRLFGLDECPVSIDWHVDVGRIDLKKAKALAAVFGEKRQDVGLFCLWRIRDNSWDDDIWNAASAPASLKRHPLSQKNEPENEPKMGAVWPQPWHPVVAE